MFPKIIAHRGYSKRFPENTLISFKEAVKAGADGIELDVHTTKDHNLIVHHDYSLDNPTKGKGLICNATLSYVRSLSGGGWFNSKFEKEKIPTLDEVFKEIGSTTHYEIELKGFTLDFINTVLKLVIKHKLLKFVEFTSPHAYTLAYIKSKNKLARVGMFVKTPEEWMDKSLAQQIVINQAKLVGIDVLHLPEKMITESFVKLIHENGFIAHVANCDTRNQIEKAVKLGVDQLSTNNLDLAIKVKKNYEK